MGLVTRTNNPLNIRHNPVNKWLGQVGDYKGFCEFYDRAFGYRAALILLSTYVKQYNCSTIDKIIARWAPPFENNTQNYCNYVKQVFRDYRFDFDIYGQTFMTLFLLVKAMAFMETLTTLSLDEFKNVYNDFKIYERF